MIRRRNNLFPLFICFFIAFLIFGFGGTSKAQATTLKASDFYFNFEAQKITIGSEAEVKLETTSVYVTAENWDSSATVTWTSSQTGVVTIEPSTNGSNYVYLKRKGPGYSNITATIKIGTSTTFNVNFIAKVGLSIDQTATGTTPIKTTGERALILNNVGDEQQICLRYVEYQDSTGATVTGSAISATAVSYESDNESVATIDDNGKVKAIGSGTAKITISSKTSSSTDKLMTTTLTVIVVPSFSLTVSSVTYNSVNENKGLGVTVNNVPSTFLLYTKATYASNLAWRVVDCSTGKDLKIGESSKMTITVNEGDGTVRFSGVKAGTYEIYAYAASDYKSNTAVPNAYMKIVVPIDLSDTYLIMNVGDTYDILENSNIPDTSAFTGVTYNPLSNGIATADEKFVITAKKKGTVEITLTYDTGSDLFEDNTKNYDQKITVTVIDGIALSMNYAQIYTDGTLLLKAITTDNYSTITWSSSDPTIASVSNGLVTGLKAGTNVTITATQKVDGVTKKATCTIDVVQAVSSVTVTPATASIAIGEFKTLKATISPDINNVTLTWRSSNDKVVKISETVGNTVTVQGVAGGSAVIAAINKDNVVVGYCHVTVAQPVTGIELSETDVTMELTTKKFQLRATVTPTNATNKSITWTSTNTAIATVDDSGMVTLVKSGNVSIIATSVDRPAVTAICNLTITVPVTSISLDETTKTMYVGQTARLTYAILPANSTNMVVTWTSTNSSVATVDSSGKVTAKSSGTTIIMLRTADGGYSSYCTITVKRVATAVKLDVSELNLKTGDYYYIKPTLTPKDSTENSLVWESSDTKVATVDSAGKVVAKGAGTAVITVKTEAGGVAYCKVNVTQPVTSLLLNLTEKTIYTNTKFTLEVSITPSNASNLAVIWKSSNNKVATVSKTGEVSGIIGGTAIITCATADGGLTATCVVTVKEPVTKVTLDYQTYSLGTGKTFTLTATISTDSATNTKLVWSTSNPSVATVNQKGKVTGIKKGYATITAMATDGSEAEATCEVRVVTPVESITINDNYVSLFVGDTSNLKATIRPTNATYNSAIWTTSDPSVAIVDDDGVVTALKAGTATITASTQDNTGKKAICLIAVYDRVPSTGITLQDKKLTMVAGEDKVVQLVLIPATSTDKYTWSTDNPAVASVNKKTGKITAKSTGVAYVTVMTDSGKTATVEVTVIGLNYTSLTLEQYTDYSDLVVEGATTTVKWTSDNPQVAVIKNTSTISTKATGTTYIIATVNGRRLKCKLTVVKIS